jgi:hypothetical protein
VCPTPCSSFQQFVLGLSSRSTIIRRFEGRRTEDLSPRMIVLAVERAFSEVKRLCYAGQPYLKRWVARMTSSGRSSVSISSITRAFAGWRTT